MDIETSHSHPSLEAAGVTAGYAPGRPILMDQSFRLDGPGIVRLDAPNGSGKSTLIEVAAGYLRPWSGHLRVNGWDAHDPRVRSSRRVCRAEPALHPHLSIQDHLALVADLTGVDRSLPRERARAFGLDRWNDTRTAELSTGTARRLWYVLCTTGRFSVALLDEPFNGVDHESTALMIDDLYRWAESALIVLVSHAVPEGLQLSSVLSLDDIREVTPCPSN